MSTQPRPRTITLRPSLESIRQSTNSRRARFSIGTPPDERAEAIEHRTRVTYRHRETSQYLHQLLNDFRASPSSEPQQIDDLIKIILSVLNDNSDLCVHWLAYGDRTVTAESDRDFWRSLKQKVAKLNPHRHLCVETVDIDSLPLDLLDATFRTPPHPESRWSSPSPPPPNESNVATVARDVADNLFDQAVKDRKQIENHTYVPLIVAITNYCFHEEFFETILRVGNERFGYDPLLPLSPPMEQEEMTSSSPTRGRSLRRAEVEEWGRTDNLEPHETIPPVVPMPPSCEPPGPFSAAGPFSVPHRGSPLRLADDQQSQPDSDVDGSRPLVSSESARKRPRSAASTDREHIDEHARLMQILAQDWPRIYHSLLPDLLSLREARQERERQKAESGDSAETQPEAAFSTSRLPPHMRNRTAR